MLTTDCMVAELVEDKPSSGGGMGGGMGGMGGMGGLLYGGKKSRHWRDGARMAAPCESCLPKTIR
jgi:hypothetical protein